LAALCTEPRKNCCYPIYREETEKWLTLGRNIFGWTGQRNSPIFQVIIRGEGCRWDSEEKPEVTLVSEDAPFKNQKGCCTPQSLGDITMFHRLGAFKSDPYK
jgi:hypothetical protein